MFTRSVSPEQAPDKPTYIEIDFEKGDPVAINGEKLSPATLLTNLNKVRQTCSWLVFCCRSARSCVCLVYVHISASLFLFASFVLDMHAVTRDTLGKRLCI